jgi:DNA-binding FadR family transcriptional regulator
MTQKLSNAEPRAGASGHATAFLSPLVSATTFDETVQQLAQLVMLGVIPPGDRLPPERVLAERLNVSRTTVREAIRSLRMTGLVETRRGRTGGNFVVDRGAAASYERARSLAREMGDRLVDALDFRRVVEPAAAELAAERLQPGDAERYQEILDEMRHNHGGSYRALDARLHLAIADCARTPSLARAVADVQMRLGEVLSRIPLLDDALARDSDKEHARLVAAITAGRPIAARQRMTSHLAGADELLRDFLD